MEKSEKKFVVKELDENTLVEIYKELENPSNVGKTINLELISTKGEIPQVIDLITKMHDKDTLVEVSVNARGEISLAGLLILAASKIDERTAKSGTSFKLFESDKTSNKNRKELTINERNALQYLTSYSNARESKIKRMMITGKTIIASEAESMTLIDIQEGFVDRYNEQRKKKAREIEEKILADKEAAELAADKD